MSNETNTRSASDVKVKINNKEISTDHLVSFATQADFGQPDMCTITIRNEDNQHSNQIDLTNGVEITADSKPVFQGEVVGLEPIYTAKGENSLMVRAFNNLHRLLRSMQSQTFMQRSDEEIITKIVGKHKLACQCGPNAKKSKPEHVYQHNQTDLEFLRIRAARLGYEIWVVDNKTVHVDAPDTNKSPVVTVEYGDAGSATGLFLEHFAPKLSSRLPVKTAEVRAWDPRKKEPIISTVQAPGSKLGSKAAHDAASEFSPTPIYQVDHPVADPAEAKMLAEGMLRTANLSYITGRGECRGSPDIKLGEIIGITVNKDGEDRFNGNYLIVGVSHRYTPQKGKKGGSGGGYITGFRVQRDAEKPRSNGKSGGQ